jgi:F-type H+-transporting ATPase subunit b
MQLTPFFLAAEDAGIAAKLSETAAHLSSTFHVDWHFFLAQVINFGIAAFVLYRYAFKPVLTTVDERNRKIAEGLQYAQDMKKKLAEAEQQHAETLKQAGLEAQKIITEARESGKAIVEKASQDAVKQAEDIIKKGHSANVIERQQMLADLKREVAQLVISTTSRVLDRDLTAEERTRFNAGAAKDLTKN